jgi:nitrile hydratase subunit beta
VKRILDRGTPVRVLSRQTDQHIRTPTYVMGKRGLITSYVGEFQDPEELAYGRATRVRHLYEVKFSLSDVWPEQEASADSLQLDIYGHWLVPTEDAIVEGG